MANRADIGTAQDKVAEPSFSRIDAPSVVAQLRTWGLSITKRVNRLQQAVVFLLANADRIEGLVNTATATGTSLESRVSTLETQMTSLDGHDHPIQIGTAAGGDAVEFSGGVDGTLDAPAGSGGNARTDPFAIP